MHADAWVSVLFRRGPNVLACLPRTSSPSVYKIILEIPPVPGYPCRICLLTRCDKAGGFLPGEYGGCGSVSGSSRSICVADLLMPRILQGRDNAAFLSEDGSVPAVRACLVSPICRLSATICPFCVSMFLHIFADFACQCFCHKAEAFIIGPLLV